MKKNDTRRERRFANVFRFIEYLTALSDSGEFGRSFKQFYAPELVLSKKNLSNNDGTCLDLVIKAQNN